MARVRGCRFAIALCVLQGIAATSLAAPASQTKIFIDDVWAGTRVGFDAVRVGDKVYIGYYDSSRHLAVAEADLHTFAVRKIRLESQFSGWDSHNYIVLSFDNFGFLHVSGNEHASSLVYARMTVPNELSSLTLLNRMTGELEEHVTYPEFFRGNDGRLIFVYRDGGSGNGNYIVKTFNGRSWENLIGTPLFGSSGTNGSVSAYPTNFRKNIDGNFCVAWVWRRTPDVSTNSDISYACSADLKIWLRYDGVKLDLPIEQGSGAGVVSVPENSGLFNDIKLGESGKGEPVISFLKYDEKGSTQLFHAALINGAWVVKAVTKWSYRWSFGGKKSIQSEISFSGLNRQHGQYVERVFNSKYGTKLYLFENDGSTVSSINDVKPSHPENLDIDYKRPLNRIVSTVRGAGDSTRFWLNWGAYSPDNRDAPRRCFSQGKPDQCELSSKLFLIGGPVH
ncbi:putative BNR repeat neuraminidase [Paraburkholderia sp. BL6669N2]|uniref:BNR repeat-containing protein n=1 Tax=Paraburkholderia sp. BL6669N2 TaxID=1938807 RepID=UPI000E288B95|nr:BNR repeat-containing protein [Paraburkholderia sp. BL6669N2]REG45622.1 putative BNR repeat neuraminidase [Paraburkholderia sp. BL6669N2]